MKNFKIFFLSALVAVAGLFTACVEDTEIAPGEFVEGPQVLFPADVQTNYTVGAADSSVSLPVMRAEAESALDVPVLVTFAEGEEGLFTVPSYAVFNAGEKETDIVISFDYATLKLGKSYQFSVALDDPTMTTPYGTSTVVLTIVVPEPYVLLGKGLYRDDLVPSIFDLGGFPEYPVEVYENTNTPGFLYMKNPYSYAKGVYIVNASNFHSFEEDVYFAIDVRNPDAVVIPEQPLGMTVDNYGDIWVRMYGDNVGKMENNIITFAPETMEQAMTLYKGGSYDYLWGNASGMFRLALPGAVLTDFSLEAEPAGHMADNSGSATPIINVKGGADVAGVAVEFVAGDITADYAAVVEAIAADAEPNYVAMAEGVCTVVGTEAMEAGQVTAVVVPYDANGVAQVESAIAIVFYFAGCSEAELPACEIDAFLGWFSEVYGPGYEEVYPDATTMAMVIQGEDIVAAKYGFITGLQLQKDLEGEEAQAVLDYVVSAIGEDPMTAIPAQYVADINGKGLASYFDELPEGYSCTLFVEGENSYGQKKLIARGKDAYVAEAATPAQQTMMGMKMIQYSGIKAAKIPFANR